MSELELELTFDEIISKKGLEYYFQDEKYKNIEILSIGMDSNQQINILNLDILLSLKNLKELFIYDCIEVTSTNNLENIKVLHIHDGFKCKKLSYLKLFPNIEELELMNEVSTDTFDLSYFNKLKKLSLIIDSTYLKYAKQLDKLKSVKELTIDFSDFNKDELIKRDINALNSMKDLEVLNIYGHHTFSTHWIDCAVINRLKNLKELNTERIIPEGIKSLFRKKDNNIKFFDGEDEVREGYNDFFLDALSINDNKHPTKLYISGLLFNQDYRLNNFEKIVNYFSNYNNSLETIEELHLCDFTNKLGYLKDNPLIFTPLKKFKNLKKIIIDWQYFDAPDGQYFDAPYENLVFDYTTLVHLPQLQSIYVDFDAAFNSGLIKTLSSLSNLEEVGKIFDEDGIILDKMLLMPKLKKLTLLSAEEFLEFLTENPDKIPNLEELALNLFEDTCIDKQKLKKLKNLKKVKMYYSHYCQDDEEFDDEEFDTEEVFEDE